MSYGPKSAGCSRPAWRRLAAKSASGLAGPARKRRLLRPGPLLWLTLLFTLLLGPLAASGQSVLLQADVAQDTLGAEFGPNRRYFGHVLMGLGLVAGPAGGPGAAVRYGRGSTELELGARLKRRCSQALALTLTGRYALLSYELAQTSRKTVPNATLHKRESLSLHQLQLEVGLRLNVGRRGNVVGRYVELLGWGGRVVGSSHRTEDPPAAGSGSTTTISRGLDYLAKWPAGLGGRLGSGRLALTSRYRLSPAFQGRAAAAPELPRATVGLEIGLF